MKKLQDDEDALPKQRPHLMGPAAQAKALAAATAKLAARRQRDALPHRIETPRLVLRAPIRGDVPDLVKLADNKAIYEVLARLPHPYTRADGVAFVEIYAQRPDERPYAITLNDQFIGVVGLTFFTDGPPELGYWLGEPHWGKGIMSEAVKGLIEAAFATRLFPGSSRGPWPAIPPRCGCWKRPAFTASAKVSTRSAPPPASLRSS